MKYILSFLLLLFFEQAKSSKSFPILVYSTLRDSRGLIWFGTENGLLLFQGNKFISYKHSGDSNSIIDGRVYALAEDENSNIWAASYTNGVTIFNPEKNIYKKITSKTHPALVGSKLLNTIEYSGNHVMQFNTESGSYRVYTNDLSFTPSLNKKYSASNILMQKEFNQYNYFLIQGVGLLQIDKNGRQKLYTIPIAEMNFMGLATHNGKLYVSGHKGIYQLADDSLRRIKILYHNRNISIEGFNDIIEDKDKQLYINSLNFGMLKTIDSGFTFHCYDIDSSHWYKTGNAIYSNYYDSQSNSFFVGTQQGLFFHKSGQHYFKEVVRPEDQIGTVKAMLHHNGKLFIGTEGGCYVLNNTLKILKQMNSQIRKIIYNFFKTKDNEIFASSSKLCNVRDLIKSDFPCNNLISDAEDATYGGCLSDSVIYLISSTDKKIIYWNRKNKDLREAKIPTENTISHPTCLWKSNIILNTFNGLFFYNVASGSGKKITQNEDSEISDVKVHDQKVYYSSHTNGLVILDSNFHQERKINISPLTTTNEVRAFEIMDSVIWFSSADGIGYFDLHNDNLAYFKSGEFFTTTNFIDCSVTSQEDTVYFGGDNGIVAVNTKAILQQNEIAKCYLLDISVYDKGNLLKVVDPINYTFKHSENNLEIRLVRTITDFSVFKHYKYKLNHNSEIPIDENGIIKLYNLSPDDYDLKVFEIESGMKVCAYSFTVAPPWYQTVWFQVLLAVVILANGIWISRLYFRRRLIAQQKELEKQQALQSERDRISTDMHDDLGSGLSSIKLISEMLKKKHDDTETKSDLNDIVDHATTLTDTMREMVWSLNPRNDLLSRFGDHTIQYAKHFFEPSEINFSILSGSELPEISMNGFVRRNLLLCLKEIFNNIIKHSLAKNVTLSLIYKESNLRIEISDDGTGIPENHKEGNGLYSIKKRITACKGTIEWNNRYPGLTIHIEIPL